MSSTVPSARADESRPGSHPALPAIVAAVCIGEGGLVTMPYLVGTVAERFGMSDGAAGMTASIQFAAMALTSAVLMLTHANSLWAFVSGLILVSTLGMFLIPYYRALTAFLDPSGGQAAASVMCQAIGTMAGPFLGGLVLSYGGGYIAVGWLCAGLGLLAAALSASTARRASLADRDSFDRDDTPTTLPGRASTLSSLES